MFNINESNGFRNFYNCIKNQKDLVFFQVVEGDNKKKGLLKRIKGLFHKNKKEVCQLKKITFAEFEELHPNEKNKVLKKIEGLIDEGKKDDPIFNKIRQIRNAMVYSIEKPEKGEEIFASLPTNVLEQLILARTSPKDIAAVRMVSKHFNKISTRKTLIFSINKGFRLKDAISPSVKTAVEALEWLKQDEEKNYNHLKYLDLRGFDDLSEEILQEFINTCPNITHLFIEKNIEKIEVFPKSLKVFGCSSCKTENLLENLPESLEVLILYLCSTDAFPQQLPKSLKVFKITFCPITSLPENLPEFLKVLDCRQCHQLTSLPKKLPESLEVLNCSHTKVNALPQQLPSSLKKLICHHSKIEELPKELPMHLRYFDFRICTIKSLPQQLPKSLENFECSPNFLDQASLQIYNQFKQQ